jgi:hypothetical protein
MQCLVCGAVIEREKSWEHIRAVHLRSSDLTREKICEHAKKTAHVTRIHLRENIIHFSLDSAELLVDFTRRKGFLG